jgi:hypothetical protein
MSEFTPYSDSEIKEIIREHVETLLEDIGQDGFYELFEDISDDDLDRAYALLDGMTVRVDVKFDR